MSVGIRTGLFEYFIFKLGYFSPQLGEDNNVKSVSGYFMTEKKNLTAIKLGVGG